jgi:predicted TIM-barrel fold metal-dependent hydrolase
LDRGCEADAPGIIGSATVAHAGLAHADRADAGHPLHRWRCNFRGCSAEQLDIAIKKQGLRGAAIGGNVAGEEFSDPKFHPVWAKAEELGAVLFIHPQAVPELAKRVKGNGWLTNTIGLPAETTIALSRLIFEGTLDRFPGLKVISAHGGGFLPSYADRSDHACFVNPSGCDPNAKLKKKPTEYLKQLYFDSLIFSPEALRHLAAQVGVSQIMLGSDHPYPWQDHPVDHILATGSLSDDEKVAILGNAATVFGLKPSEFRRGPVIRKAGLIRRLSLEGGRAAALDGRHHLQLAEAHIPGICSASSGPMVMKDVRDLQPRAAHRRRAKLAILPGARRRAANRPSS